ncbi:AraC family transcriptional regulator [Flavobacterium sp. NKUCC04_CG]|uniref:helix-turn-helix domain-containing protein n=1 Tax=Flavobacterium sp. NKUCC04_CG TaxID=2842121 RepID=UPI001C5A985C|nr:helix-turn-helix domain-containing protein [Flavobacterium sp. NKUCC04_CG]MBW3519811.1 helix-turn-helix transcriptional regulator [Flavobacterium sp. NKUCC04_CG]
MFHLKDVSSIVILCNAIFFIINCLLICFNSRNSRSNIYIIVFLGVLMVNALYDFLFVLFSPNLKFFILVAPFGLLYGPCVALYLKSRFNFLKTFKKNYYHFIIPIIFWMVFILLSVNPYLYQKFALVYIELVVVFSGIHLAFYGLVSLFLLFRNNINNNTGLKEGMCYLILCHLILSGILIGSAFNTKINVSYYIDFSIVMYFFILVKVLIIKVMIFRSYTTSNPDYFLLAKKTTNSEALPKLKYGRSRIESEVLNKNAHLLSELELGVFLDSSLDLKSLAVILGITTFELSQTFSLQLNTSFSSYVNNKRVEFATLIMETEEYENLVDIAFRSGFNSRASFYRAFKERYNLSPDQYRKKNIAASE